MKYDLKLQWVCFMKYGWALIQFSMKEIIPINLVISINLPKTCVRQAFTLPFLSLTFLKQLLLYCKNITSAPQSESLFKTWNCVSFCRGWIMPGIIWKIHNFRLITKRHSPALFLLMCLINLKDEFLPLHSLSYLRKLLPLQTYIPFILPSSHFPNAH